MLLVNGPLREGLSAADAAATYSALANPDTFALMAHDQNWTPQRFEAWLADSMTRLLLR